MYRFMTQMELRKSKRRYKQIEQDIYDLKVQMLTLQDRLVQESEWQDELKGYLGEYED